MIVDGPNLNNYALNAFAGIVANASVAVIAQSGIYYYDFASGPQSGSFMQSIWMDHVGTEMASMTFKSLDATNGTYSDYDYLFDTDFHFTEGGSSALATFSQTIEAPISTDEYGVAYIVLDQRGVMDLPRVEFVPAP